MGVRVWTYLCRGLHGFTYSPLLAVIPVSGPFLLPFPLSLEPFLVCPCFHSFSWPRLEYLPGCLSHLRLLLVMAEFFYINLCLNSSCSKFRRVESKKSCSLQGLLMWLVCCISFQSYLPPVPADTLPFINSSILRASALLQILKLGSMNT